METNTNNGDFPILRQRLNKESDIAVRVDFVNDAGQPIPVPTTDWALTFYTDERHSIECSHNNTVLSRCCVKDGVLTCLIPAGSLGCGTLYLKKRISVFDERFPDGRKDDVSVVSTDYEVADPQDTIGELDIVFSITCKHINMILEADNDYAIITEDGDSIIDLNRVLE